MSELLEFILQCLLDLALGALEVKFHELPERLQIGLLFIGLIIIGAMIWVGLK